MSKYSGSICLVICVACCACSSEPHKGSLSDSRIGLGSETKGIRSTSEGDETPYPGPDTPKLISMLRTHRFSDLEHYFKMVRSRLSPGQGQWDNGQEWLLIQSYKRISGIGADNQYDLNEWVKASPHSSEAKTALAFCTLDLSWAARGTELIRDTSKQQIESMQMLSQLSENYAQQALQIASDDPAPYRVLIRLAHLRGASSAIPVATQAISKFPLSYNLRVHLMEALEPRWGGSYEAMLYFAEASQQFSVLNPKMKVLLGFPYWARGRTLSLADDDKGALEQFTEALTFGDEIDFYDEKIKTEKILGLEDAARADDAKKTRLFPTGE